MQNLDLRGEIICGALGRTEEMNRMSIIPAAEIKRKRLGSGELLREPECSAEIRIRYEYGSFVR